MYVGTYEKMKQWPQHLNCHSNLNSVDVVILLFFIVNHVLIRQLVFAGSSCSKFRHIYISTIYILT